MNKVIERIKALGSPPRTSRPPASAFRPQYDYDQQAQKPLFRGYQASNRVSIELRKIEEAGKVLDALVEAGATDINGPDFALEDDTARAGSGAQGGDAQARPHRRRPMRR